MESTSGTADHLLVLIHGLWGEPKHLRYLATTIRETYDQDQLHILVPKSNSNSFTYDGIETGGERITHEIEAEIKRIEDGGVTIRKLSIVGYSLGGLLARYAIGLLYADGLFDRIEPVNFTTFATPHLGVRSPGTGTVSSLWNILGARTLSTSGRQIFLVDSFRDTGRPLLATMADRNSIFLRGLSQFKHRTLYANLVNDRSVVYYTAAIDSTDPYIDMTKVTYSTLPGTEGVILDPAHATRQTTPTTLSLFQRVSSGAISTVSSIPFYVLFSVFMPIGAAAYLTNAGIQSFRSTQRVKLHDSGRAGITVDRYRKTPFITEELKVVTDRMYRQATAATGEEFLPTPPPEEQERQPLFSAASQSEVTLVGNSAHKDSEAGLAEDERFPTLALTKDQFEMIDALNEVGFTKYRVHITSVRHTHAAIVVRISWRPGFDQGRIVVKHWVEGFVI